jgi:hypothetical protein
MKKIVAVAEQARPGIEPYRVTVDDVGVVCTDDFHTAGEGGTEWIEVGGGWTLSHCPRIDCDGTARLHEVLHGNEPDLPSFTCPQCHVTSYNPNDVEWGFCGNCHAYTGYVDPLMKAKRFIEESEQHE